MLGQLIALQLDKVAKTDLPAQRLVLKGFFQLVLYGFHEHLLASIVQQAAVQFLVEVLFLNLPTVEYAEDDAVYDNGLENLRHVETERIASLAWRMQIADGRVKLRLMDGPRHCV